MFRLLSPSKKAKEFCICCHKFILLTRLNAKVVALGLGTHTFEHKQEKLRQVYSYRTLEWVPLVIEIFNFNNNPFNKEK